MPASRSPRLRPSGEPLEQGALTSTPAVSAISDPRRHRPLLDVEEIGRCGWGALRADLRLSLGDQLRPSAQGGCIAARSASK